MSLVALRWWHRPWWLGPAPLLAPEPVQKILRSTFPSCRAAHCNPKRVPGQGRAARLVFKVLSQDSDAAFCGADHRGRRHGGGLQGLPSNSASWSRTTKQPGVGLAAPFPDVTKLVFSPRNLAVRFLCDSGDGSRGRFSVRT